MGSTYRDFEPWEIACAIIIAVCVQVGTGTGMYLAEPDDRCKREAPPSCPAGELAKCGPGGWECKPSCAAPPPKCDEGEQPTCEADVWECRPPEEIVAMKPVIDEEAFEKARLGGKKAVLPEMWDRAPESVKKKIQEQPAPPKDTTVASTKLDGDEIPDAGKVISTDASGEGPEDAEASLDPPDAEPQEGADAGQAEGSEDAAVATLDTDGGTSSVGGPGCQGPGCSKDGTSDDFIAAQHYGRLQSFFKRGFTVSGLGLPPEEIKKLAVSVSVTISADGTVTSFSMGSSGNATFDAAAKAQIQSKVGSQAPLAPEDRPDLQRSSLSLTLTCGSGCN